MVELYKIKSDGEIHEIKKFPFSDEVNDLEDFIMKNEGVLGNVTLLNRQIVIPTGKRIDIWGLDTLDFRPIIIELKNVTCGLEIIPQILPYYNFVKSNPDTLKLKAISDTKFQEKLRSLEVDEQKLTNGLEGDPKIIIIAPSFKEELLNIVDYVKFDIELIEISRYKSDIGDPIVTINKPQTTITPPAITRVMEDWTWEKYKVEGISDRKLEIAKGIKASIDDLLQKENIELKPIFRKLYIPYQFGRNNVILIDLQYTSWTNGDIRLSFKIDEKPDLDSEGITIEHTKTRWFKDYGEWSIFFNKIVDLTPLLPIIKKAYRNIAGEK